MQQSSLILMQNFKNSCNFYITLAFYLTYIHLLQQYLYNKGSWQGKVQFKSVDINEIPSSISYIFLLNIVEPLPFLHLK